MKRQIITIDEAKCDGCGLCIPNCPEGALAIVEGKARLVKDSLCDGLGACLGQCPRGAISVEERECGSFDEKAVMENIVAQGPKAVEAHLNHLKEHKDMGNLQIALDFLSQNRPGSHSRLTEGHPHEGGCPGARSFQFKISEETSGACGSEENSSALGHWPIQLHLISPKAPAYEGKDVVLAADCVAFALGSFHGKYLKGKSLAIACPKLDHGQELYREKICALMEQSRINTLTVMTMAVPCCSGLLQLARSAAAESKRKVPIKHVVVGLEGNIMNEDWI